MKKGVLLCIIAFSLFVGVCSKESHPKKQKETIQSSFCSWMPKEDISVLPLFRRNCTKDQFQCFNGNCIRRLRYCDGLSNCGDNSDELYCSDTYYKCPFERKFVKCYDSRKCVPDYFLCDGVKDCPNGDDERNCVKPETKMDAMPKVLQWIKSQRKSQLSPGKWGAQVDKSAVALYFTEKNFTLTNDEFKRDLAYEVSIQLLSRLSMKMLQDIPSTDLASFVNAFHVTCLDPRNFHGIDLVQELRTRVNRQNYTNPYVLLSLCIAGDPITEMDKMKLIDTFWSKHRPFWTDMQAFVVMALACANKQSANEEDLVQMSELTMELKQRQYRNGSIENLQTTALVMQALIAAESEADPDNFDEKKAVEEILKNQQMDGSFGDLQNTYFVTPVLFCKSFVDINSDHCEIVQTDEITALENLVNQGGTKIRVQYSLWIGNKKDLERSLALRVPENVSFYRVMELAAEIDSRYKFEYVVKDRKPYINGVSGFRDNPEKGKFWFLYQVQDGKTSLSQQSPADVKPKENDHFVMWYRTGSWTD